MQKNANCNRPIPVPGLSQPNSQGWFTTKDLMLMRRMFPLTVNKTIVNAMKLTFIFLTVAFLQVSAKGWSQVVTLAGKDVKLETIFSAIEKQTGYVVFYNKNLLRNARSVSLTVQNMPLAEFLAAILKDQPITYEMADKTIMLSPKNLATAPVFIPVSGTILSADGTPLPGASVKIKGNKSGTVTDANGRFMINAAEGDVLVISFVGFEEATFRVNDKTTTGITIRISPSENKLDQVQVMGYGTTSKRFNTGNITTVKAEDIERQPVSNPLSALQGRVPGMVITQSTGVPGGSFKVQIRGRNSMRVTANDPLYIVDGVPYLANMVMGVYPNDLTNGGSPMNFINPQDIESIDILKDADATAIYGSRGANGVILITTKKGKAGKTLITANVTQGTAAVSKMMPLLNTRQYLDMRYEAYRNDGVDWRSATVSTAAELKNYDTTRYTDWQKEFLGNTASYTDAQLSMTGGNSQTQYLVGGSYHRETTVFPGKAADQRGTMHFNINTSSDNQKLKVLLTGGYTIGNNNLPRYDFIDLAFSLPPIAPKLYNPDGSPNWQGGLWQNPIARSNAKFGRKVNNFITNAAISCQILPGLDIKSTFGYTFMHVDETANFPIAYYNPSLNVNGSAEFSNSNNRTWLIEPQITYTKDLWKGRLSALVGSTIQQNTANGQYVTASGFISDGLIGNLASASSITPMNSLIRSYKYNSLFARFNYNIEEKYILNLTMRRDGSDRFGPDNRFGNFGAVGAAWIFSKENFIVNNLPFISFGKLRGSYGTTGNDAVGDYEFMRYYTVGGNPYQGVRGLGPNNLHNPSYRWEVNKKLEGGLEFGFLKDLISVSASYYNNRSGNQLVGYRVPAHTGFTSVTANWPAVVENQGWEFVLGSNNVKIGEVTWNSSFNISVATNKLVAFPGIENTSYKSQYVIGQSLDIIRVYRYVGVDPATGMYQFLDKDNKKQSLSLNALTDKVGTMNKNPVYYGGFQNSIRYKGFDLDFIFQFAKQTGQAYRGAVLAGVGTYMQGNQHIEVLDRWQKPGDVSMNQRFNADRALSWPNSYFRESDGSYSDASFIRLKNIQLTYSFSNKINRKIGLQQSRVFLQSQNLFTITNFKGMDPENQSGSSLPPLRVLTAGIKITI